MIKTASTLTLLPLLYSSLSSSTCRWSHISYMELIGSKTSAGSVSDGEEWSSALHAE
jgi:hypothetical protein